jgi:hypothetical protein
VPVLKEIAPSLKGIPMDVLACQQKAAQCRRIAGALLPNDPAYKLLLKMAKEYEVMAEQVADRRPQDPATT